jgi:hypothetical protein
MLCKYLGSTKSANEDTGMNIQYPIRMVSYPPRLLTKFGELLIDINNYQVGVYQVGVYQVGVVR